MKKKLEKAMSNFYHYFRYFPELPPRIDFDQDAYADLLDKCVNDKFDYTIEKYGTVPPIYTGRPEIIID
ncbi:MAG: hypothetical protein ACI4U3_06425 [Traorella sp.]